ncbi:MAG: MBL fold metallo-hydrolase [Planctomycetaceae bacterium]|nr:MBL fold metallo-hydrolase [Planctomycetaceae bacterium]
MADVQITVLADNAACRDGLVAEHGLAMWIELGGRAALFDTGQGPALAANAPQLGVRLDRAEAVVLSHGHYDHTGGLVEALRNSVAEVYVHPAAIGPKWSARPGRAPRDVAAPAAAREALAGSGVRWITGPVTVWDSMRLTGPIPRLTDFEDTGGAFFSDQACTQRDALPDDQAAYIETPAGTVVVLGCAHAGVINTLWYVQALTNHRPIHTLIGGMHLHSASPGRMDATITELRALGVRRLLPCHCTGAAAVDRLQRELGSGVMPCSAGSIIAVP